MKILIELPEDPTPDQLARARATLDFISAGFKSSASPTALTVSAVGGIVADDDEDDDIPGSPSGIIAPTADGGFQTTVASPALPERDATGLPWDERIHSSKKTKNQDGSWKKRKGVGDALVVAVEAELRSFPSGTVAPVAPPPPAPPAPVAPPPPAPPAPVAAAPVAPPPPGDNPFVAMMKKAGPRLAAKTLTNEQIVQACQSVGLNTLPELAQRHDLVPTVEAILGL